MKRVMWNSAAALVVLAGGFSVVMGAEPAPAKAPVPVKEAEKKAEASAAVPVGLRFAGQAGVDRFYRWSSDQVFKTTTEGAEPSERRATVSIVFKVLPKEVGAAGSVCEVSILTYAFENIAGGKRIIYDSQLPPTDMMQQTLDAQLRPLMRVPVTVKSDASGRVQSVEGVDRLPETPAKQKLVGEVFSVGGMQRKLGPVLGTRAEGEGLKVEAGAKWTSVDHFELAPGAVAESKGEHTIEQVEGGWARIAIHQVGKMPPAPEVSTGKMSFDDIITTGTQVWDVSKGVLASFESTQTSNVRRGEGPGAMAQAVSLTQKIEPTDAPPAPPAAPAPPAPPAPAAPAQPAPAAPQSNK